MVGQPDGQIRVGTAEREAAIKALGEHLSTGPTPHYRPPPPSPHPIFQTQSRIFQTQSSGLSIRRTRCSPLYGHEFNRPLSDKSKPAAGLLQILLPFGIGRFYTGHMGMAAAQLCLSLMWVGVIWSIIDGILILTQGGIDSQGQQLRD